MYSKNLIGNWAIVVDSKDPTLIRREGLIIDETRSMLMLIDDRGRRAQIAKATSNFELQVNGEKILLSGNDIVGTPQERIHKV